MNLMNSQHPSDTVQTKQSSAVPRMRLWSKAVCVLMVTLVSACATRTENAPITELSANTPPPTGYYRVKSGDTLYRIALHYGRNYRDLMQWNSLTNPSQIEVNQVLRVEPPVDQKNTTVVAGGAVASAPSMNPAPAVQNNTGVVITAPPSVASVPANTAASSASVVAPVAPVVKNAQTVQSAPSVQNTQNVQNITWRWPVHGLVNKRFDAVKNKGIDITGALGEPVRAAASGRVVYSGNGLRGYPNLIIIKHNADYLTAYANNQTLLVKEGDAISQGQNIATMGSGDNNGAMLHFEIRKQGKPVDPLKFLPPQ